MQLASLPLRHRSIYLPPKRHSTPPCSRSVQQNLFATSPHCCNCQARKITPYEDSYIYNVCAIHCPRWQHCATSRHFSVTMWTQAKCQKCDFGLLEKRWRCWACGFVNHIDWELLCHGCKKPRGSEDVVEFRPTEKAIWSDMIGNGATGDIDWRDEM